MSGVTLLSSSSFRHSLLLERAVVSLDELGGEQTVWHTLRQIWGHIEPIRVDMRERAGQTDETASHRIYVRQPMDIRSDDRFRRGTRVFNIDTILDPDETARYWMIVAKEQGK